MMTAMRLTRWALQTAAALFAGSQTADAQLRCPGPAQAPAQWAPHARLASPRLNPGPRRVQDLLRQMAADHGPNWGSPCRYAAANAAQRQAGRPVAVFIGDSITQNWAVADPAFFANGFVDRGITGQTSAQMLVRFMADAVALRPAVVHIMAGTNDIAENGGPVTDEFIENNITAMVDLATANGIRVVLASIPPAKFFFWSPGILPALRIRALNQWLRHYAEQRGIGYIDYYSLLADPDGGLRVAYSDDGVHPQAAGYAVMARAARDAIARARR